MTTIASDRRGLDIGSETISKLRTFSDRTSTEEVDNKLSGRTERRTTFFREALDVCTLVFDQGSVVEIQSGLFSESLVKEMIEEDVL